MTNKNIDLKSQTHSRSPWLVTKLDSYLLVYSRLSANNAQHYATFSGHRWTPYFLQSGFGNLLIYIQQAGDF